MTQERVGKGMWCTQEVKNKIMNLQIELNVSHNDNKNSDHERYSKERYGYARRSVKFPYYLQRASMRKRKQ